MPAGIVRAFQLNRGVIETAQLAAIRQFAARMSQAPPQPSSTGRMRQVRASKKTQSTEARRPHKGQYLKGCQCDWCAAYRERAREHGREGARQSELTYQFKNGRCEGCSDPIHANARLCAFCCQPLSHIGYANCVICKKLFVTSGPRERKTCGKAECQRKYRDVRVRNREHMRRAVVSDITPEQELAMRRRTRKCRLCGVYMTSKQNRPNSKHLDHILPIGHGGTHTHGNVRIICRTCNLSRPKDGSDFTGQLTLWAQEPGLAPRLSGHWNESRGTCRKGLHPWIPANIEHNGSKRRCKPCREAYELKAGKVLRQCKCGAMFPAPGRAFLCPECMLAVGKRIGELHASGMTYREAGLAAGYLSGNGTGASHAARRAGYVPVPQPPKPKPERLCPDCGTPKADGCATCQPCAEAKARQAAELRYGQGLTLETIASRLGLASKSSVTNLLGTAAAIDARAGLSRMVTDDDVHSIAC